MSLHCRTYPRLSYIWGNPSADITIHRACHKIVHLYICLFLTQNWRHFWLLGLPLLTRWGAWTNMCTPGGHERVDRILYPPGCVNWIIISKHMRTPWGTLTERQLKLSKHIRTPGGGLTETYVIIWVPGCPQLSVFPVLHGKPGH